MVNVNKLREPLYSKIADDLRERIIIGDLPRDTHLNEVALAEEYNVSRGPIRDAIQSLVNEGFATSLGNGRTIVAPFSIADIKTYYEMRFYIEKNSLFRIFEDISEEEYGKLISVLDNILSSSKILGASTRDGKYNELDIMFHFSIVDAANQKIYTQIWLQLSNYGRSIMNLNHEYLFDLGMMERIFDDPSHEELLSALKDRDLDCAVSVLRRHMDNGLKLFGKILNRSEDMRKLRCERMRQMI